MGNSENRGKNRGRRSGDNTRGGNFGGSGRRFTGGYGRTGGGGRSGGGGYSSSGSYNRGPRPNTFQSAPVETGKEYEVEIVDVSRRGEGIAKIQGFIIFVPGGKPGPQKVKIKIERISARFANGSLVGGASTEDDSDSSSEGEDSSSSNDSESTNVDSSSMVESV